MVAKCKECGHSDWEKIRDGCAYSLPLWQCKKCKRVIEENEQPLFHRLDKR